MKQLSAAVKGRASGWVRQIVNVRRPGAALDLGEQGLVPAHREHGFGGDEQRASWP